MPATSAGSFIHAVILTRSARTPLTAALRRGARPAGFEIGQPAVELALELLMPPERRARLLELASRTDRRSRSIAVGPRSAFHQRVQQPSASRGARTRCRAAGRSSARASTAAALVEAKAAARSGRRAGAGPAPRRDGWRCTVLPVSRSQITDPDQMCRFRTQSRTPYPYVYVRFALEHMGTMYLCQCPWHPTAPPERCGVRRSWLEGPRTDPRARRGAKIPRISSGWGRRPEELEPGGITQAMARFQSWSSRTRGRTGACRSRHHVRTRSLRPEEEHVVSSEDDVVPPVGGRHQAVEQPFGCRGPDGPTSSTRGCED